MGSEGTLRVKVVGDVSDAQAKFGAFGSTIQKFAGYAVGAALGGAFAAMTKGAVEMERAQGNFQAATGRSRDEAVQFSRDMNGLVGQAYSVGRSFDEIAATGTKVAQQFQLTGNEGQKMTAKFLEFSQVTKQDAVGAVDAFDAVLDAFGEPVERASSLMDQLIASNQRFGTDAGPAALQALQDMAPALQALGLSLDDGVAFLNAYELAGGHAETATRGLNKAIGELKPGQTIDDLIAQIGSIEDPLKRAQAAAEIFGTKSGSGLANAIKPGMDSLDNFGVSAEDAAGTLDTASANMETTTDKIRGMFDKLLGGARDVGSQFGPLLSGIGGVASLAAPLATAFKKMLITSAGLILPQAIASGTATGAATGTAQAAAQAEAAAGQGAISRLFAKVAAMSLPLAPAGTTVGSAIGGAMASGVIAGLTGAGLAVLIQDKLVGGLGNVPQAVRDQGHMLVKSYAQGMTEAIPGALEAFDAAAAAEWEKSHDVNAAQLAGRAAGNAYIDSVRESAFQGQMASLIASERDSNDKAYRDLGLAIPEAVAAGVDTGMPRFVESVAQFDPALHEEILKMHQDAAWGGEQTPGAYSQGLRSNFDQVQTAFEDLADLMKNTLSPVKQEAELIGIATSERLRKGLDDTRPEVRAASQQIALDTITQLNRIKPGSEEAATLAMQLMASATVAEKPAILDALQEILGVYDAQTGKFGQGGENLADAWGDRFMARFRQTRGDINDILRQIAGDLHGQSPPKTGPLHTIDKGAWNIADVWVRNFTGRLRLGVREISGVFANMGAAAGGIGGALGIGTIAPPILGATASSGASYTGGAITVNAYGYAPGDVTRELERAKRREALMWDLEAR